MREISWIEYINWLYSLDLEWEWFEDTLQAAKHNPVNYGEDD